MGGLGTGSGTAYGTTGRNLNGKGKTLSVSELKRVLPMHGVDHVWVVGPLLKARFLVLLSLSRDLGSGSMSLCSMFTLRLILHFTNRRIRDPYVRWCETKVLTESSVGAPRSFNGRGRLLDWW